MKKIIISFVVLFLLSCSNRKIDNSWKKLNLKAKVSTYSTFGYNVKVSSGKILKGKRGGESFDTKRKFDKNGNLIEFTYYYALDGKMTRRYTYKYDKRGNKIEVIHYYPDGTKDMKNTYKYNKKGNIIEENWLNPKTYDTKITYKLDHKGNRIEANLNGKLKWKWTYKYDEKGNIIEKIKYNSNDSLINIDTYKFDEQNHKIESTKHYPYSKRKLIFNYITKFDNNGNPFKQIFYTSHSWNVSQSQGSIRWKKTYEYEFDNNGNWTTKIVFVNGVPKYIYERKIDYY